MSDTSSKSVDATLPLIIVNPRSAGGSTQDIWTAAASDLRTYFGPFASTFTEYAGHATVLAREAAEAGTRFIIACGGDGTINEVANGILLSGRDVELGVLPSGTGGDFRRTLGIPGTGREAAAALRTGVTRRIDVGKVTFLNHQDRETTRYFVNVSSVGLAVQIVKRVKAEKAFEWLPVGSVRGKLSFAYGTLSEVLDLSPVTVRVRVDDGEEHHLRTLALCVANSRFFGGGMKIAPDASINDGFFDIVNIGDLSTARLLLHALTIYRGSHRELEEVKTTRARRIEIFPSEPGQEVLLETDGELPGKLPAIYETVPEALAVRVPRPNFT